MSSGGHSPSPRAEADGGAAVARDTWVQCTVEGCGKWRRVRGDADDLKALEGNVAWTCADGTNDAYASCDEPQELSDDEIDELIALALAQEEAAEVATRMAAPRADPEPGNSARGKKKRKKNSAPSPPSPGTAHQAPRVEARPVKRRRLDASIEGGAAPAMTTGNVSKKARYASQAKGMAAKVTGVANKLARSAGASRGSGAPSAKKRAAGATPGQGIVLGCPKCRYATKGCARCKSTAYGGARGPRVRNRDARVF